MHSSIVWDMILHQGPLSINQFSVIAVARYLAFLLPHFTYGMLHGGLDVWDVMPSSYVSRFGVVITGKPLTDGCL